MSIELPLVMYRYPFLDAPSKGSIRICSEDSVCTWEYTEIKQHSECVYFSIDKTFIRISCTGYKLIYNGYHVSLFIENHPCLPLRIITKECLIVSRPSSPSVLHPSNSSRTLDISQSNHIKTKSLHSITFI